MSRLSISLDPRVHILLAALIGAAVPVLAPAVADGFQSADLSALNVAAGAGVGAVLRSLAMLIPVSSPKA